MAGLEHLAAGSLSRHEHAVHVWFGERRSHPVWSPDGSRIIFSSNRDGNYDLYQKPTSGVKDAEATAKVQRPTNTMSWSRDGRFLLYRMFDPKTDWDFWVLPLEGDKKPVPFLVNAFREGEARFSPDGHWVAYISDESGHYEVYVRSFAMNSTGTAVEAGGKWQISNGYGVDRAGAVTAGNFITVLETGR